MSEPDGWNIALVGATGAVGEALLKQLAESQLPVGKIWPLASAESVGQTLRFSGRSLRVNNIEDFNFSQAQLAFFVAGMEVSVRYAEKAADAGCLVIDNSGLFALEPDVPLHVPDVNSHVLSSYRNRNIISVADSLTCQLLAVIKPLIDEAGLSRLQVTTLLSASVYGRAAIESLAGESARLLNGVTPDAPFFGRQLAFNILPLQPDHQGSVSLERTLVDQVRKVLQDDALPLTVSIVQSPVFYGNTQIVNLESLRPLSPEEAGNILSHQQIIKLPAGDDFPTPAGEADVYLKVGHPRHDYGISEILNLWTVADNIHFGGALMALKTAEKLIAEYLC